MCLIWMLGWVCRRYCCDGELLVFAVISGLWVGWVGFYVFRLGDLVGFLVWLMWVGLRLRVVCGLDLWWWVWLEWLACGRLWLRLCGLWLVGNVHG